MKTALRLVLILVLVGLVAALLVPNTTLAWLRSTYPWLGDLGNRLDNLSLPGLNLDHIIAFGALGLIAALALPKVRSRDALKGIVFLAFGTELLQVLVPGRSARLGDLAMDVAGGVLGWALVWGVRQGIGKSRVPTNPVNGTEVSGNPQEGKIHPPS